MESLKGRNPGSVGAALGFGLALSLVIFGLVKTLFLIGMTLLGYFLGVRYFSNKEAFRNLLDKILPPGMFR
ncbi:MAG: DUF2273 domain-containing protein [Clostridiaceae bacterium]|nr:DUF2273 domain-containing protein [Clostridiaceae bacterium]